MRLRTYGPVSRNEGAFRGSSIAFPHVSVVLRALRCAHWNFNDCPRTYRQLIEGRKCVFSSNSWHKIPIMDYIPTDAHLDPFNQEDKCEFGLQ